MRTDRSVKESSPPGTGIDLNDSLGKAPCDLHGELPWRALAWRMQPCKSAPSQAPGSNSAIPPIDWTSGLLAQKNRTV